MDRAIAALLADVEMGTAADRARRDKLIDELREATGDYVARIEARQGAIRKPCVNLGRMDVQTSAKHD
jgi:hypothetical protein